LASSTGAIKGRIYNRQDHTSIDSVTVRTSPATSQVLADKNGDYSLLDIPPTTYNVIAFKSGFKPDTVAVTVRAESTTKADLTLSPQ
jgi:hypothetical protein